MTKHDSILELDQLRIAGDPAVRSGILRAGERWDWNAPTASLCEMWGDVLQGLAEPEEGTVRFIGGAPREHCNRVGRIFCGTAFVSNLSIEENIRVAPLFERDREAERELERGLAETLAACGVDRLSAERPARLSESEKCFWQWVRAFSRPRDLFILEDAFRLLPETRRAPLMRLLDRALADGAACITLSYP